MKKVKIVKPKKTAKKPALTKELAVYKAKEFEAFAAWMSLPSILFKIAADDAKLEALGIDSEEVRALLRIKNKGEFAKAFGLHPGTITEWSQKLAASGHLEEIRGWAQQLTKNVVLALYRQILIEGDAPRVKAWMQIIEKLEIDQPTAIKVEINQRILKIGEKYEQELAKEIEADIHRS